MLEEVEDHNYSWELPLAMNATVDFKAYKKAEPGPGPPSNESTTQKILFITSSWAKRVPNINNEIDDPNEWVNSTRMDFIAPEDFSQPMNITIYSLNDIPNYYFRFDDR